MKLTARYFTEVTVSIDSIDGIDMLHDVMRAPDVDGLSFVLDFNVERQWVASDEKEIAYIYLDTIGLMNKINKNYKNLFYFLEPVKLFGKGEYNLNVLKEIQVTEDFQSLGEEITGCQTREVDCRPNLFYESSKYVHSKEN